MKYYKISFLLFGVIFASKLFAQESVSLDPKVDSVFNSYFNFLTRDTSNIDSIDYDLLGKEFEKAIVVCDFLENITGHFQQRLLYKEHEYPENDYGWYCYSPNNAFTKVCVVYSQVDYDIWNDWYTKNKSLLVWVDDEKKIKSKTHQDFCYIDYNQLYPSCIRFKDKEDWIPISNKPKQVIDLEKQTNNAGLLKKGGELKY